MSGENRLLDEEELRAAAAELETWTFEGDRIRRRFRFADFRAAMSFMVRVAFEAEELCHHPDWHNVYDRVEVELWSHDLGGISSACVELARRMESHAGRPGA